jgi:hypothetical protein
VGVASCVTAIAGASAGLGAYVLYSADLINSNTSANLIIVSLLCSLVAAAAGFIARRRAKAHNRQDGAAELGMVLALGTFGVWFIVVAVALGK